jgi:hypothetical protein
VIQGGNIREKVKACIVKCYYAHLKRFFHIKKIMLVGQREGKRKKLSR